jgi:anti-sigma B factor antagonist
MLTDGTPRTGRSPRPASPPDRDRLREPIMSLALTDDGSAKLITVSGEIDMSNAHLLTELVEFVCRQPVPVVALDLSAVRFFSAHGVSALLQAQDIATDARAVVLLRDPAPCVTHILATTGALRSFRVNEAGGRHLIPPRRPR